MAPTKRAARMPTRIPTSAALAALASKARAPRTSAQATLRSAAFSEGAWTSAAAGLVSSLIDLAVARKTPDRHRVIALLADVLAGDHTSKLDRAPARERKVHEPAEERVSELVALASDKDARVRAAAAMMFAFLPGIHQEALPVLVQKAHMEQDLHVKASALVALGLAGLDVASWDALAKGAKHDFARGASAVIEARRGGRVDLTRIGAFVVAGDVGQDVFPWHHGRADALTFQLLRGSVAAASVAPAFAHAAAKHGAGSMLGGDSVWFALALAFDETTTIRRASELTPVQRGVIETLTMVPRLGQEHIYRYGVPGTHSDRLCWLGVEPLTVFERPVPGTDQPTYEWLIEARMRASDAELVARVKDMFPLEVAAEIVCGIAGRAVYGMKPLDLGAAFSFVEQAPKAALPWASRTAAALVDKYDKPGAGPFRIGNLVVYVHLLNDHSIPAKLDGLICVADLGPDVVRALIDALPEERRLAALLGGLEDSPRSKGYMAALDVAPLFTLAPRPQLARALLQSVRVAKTKGWSLTDELRETVLQVLADRASDPAIAKAMRDIKV